MVEIVCDICSNKFGSKESLEQHAKAKHGAPSVAPVSGSKKKRVYILIVLILAIIGIISYTLYVRGQPGKYDDFAKCLTEKGAVIYGNDFCSYTTKELNWFGSSKKYLNYVKCIDNKEVCDSKEVEKTPTWEINGKTYSGVQGFKKLAEVSGCALP